MKICMEINQIRLAYNAVIREYWHSIYDADDDAECYNTVWPLAAELVFDQWNPKRNGTDDTRCLGCLKACRSCDIFYDAVEARIKKDVRQQNEIHVTD